MISIVLSDFGTCNKITIQLYLNYGTINNALNFSRILGVIKYDV